MQQNALEIAQNYQDSQRWVDSAQTLRQPYWDWATNSVPPPQVIQQTTITILGAPNGSPIEVTNPLFQYTFNPDDISNFPDPWNSWQTTIRSPDDPNSPDATTDVQLLISYDFYFTTSRDPRISHSFYSY
jgi:tyrosinase